MTGPGSCGCSSDVRTDEAVCFCPAAGLTRTIGRRHAMTVLGTIGNAGPIRFSELRRRLGGISTSTLASRLDELEADELVMRELYAEVPPRVEYSLTPKGTALRDRLKGLLPLVAPPAGHRSA